jgi:phytoene desaturase
VSLRGRSALVVGAGFGGLAAAAQLAARGAQVTVLERAAEVGGKAAFLERDGFSFDAGPTLLTMPEIVRETFAATGTRLDDVVDLVRLDPICRYVLPDGREFSIHRDGAKTEASIAAIAPEDAARWQPFVEECARIYEAAGRPYLDAPYDGALGFAQRMLRGGPRAVKLSTGFSSLADVGRKYFRSAAMRACVGRFATYAGGAPDATSAAFAMVVWVEVALGAFYPRGGIHRLARALAAAVEAMGVRIVRSAEVTALTFTGERATGAFVEGGAHFAADLVVCDVDPLTVVQKLVPPSMATRARAELEAREPSLSGFAWAFGVEGPMPSGAHHNVIFPRDYDAEFDAIFRRGVAPEDPTVYVSVPSVSDASRAPAGCHSVFTLVNAPASAAVDPERMRAVVLARLERSFAPGIGARIRSEAFVTPSDIARTGAAGGAIYGAAPHGVLAPFERPRNRADFARGLYFVGGATHPGGGVPLVMRGGRFVAELAERDLAPRPLQILRDRVSP